MRVVVVLEHRFRQTPDGAVWTDGPGAYSFWQRYLAVFDEVLVVARVATATDAGPEFARADGPHVTFAAVPIYIGPREYLRKARAVRRAVRDAIAPDDAVILRVSSHLASLAFPLLRRRGQPYAVEVVADPYDVFAPGAIRHPLRPWFRTTFVRSLRSQCRHACAAAYVTAAALQRRYPPGRAAYSAYYSDVQIDGQIAEHPRPVASARPCRLVMVGGLGHFYKAPDVLIDAVARCVQEGLDLRLTLVGDGKHRPELQSRAAALGLADRVCFRGQLPAGAAVREELDHADLFVLPSRQEGLPRAMIEAMARGLPCVGSDVGGIPELLPPEDMVPPNDTEGLARKIREVAADPQRMARMSARNLEIAKEYREDLLESRRTEFYRHVRRQTEQWQTSYRAGTSTEERPQKVILVCNRDQGLWRFRRGLMEALLRRRIEVVAATPPGPWVDKIVRLGVRHIPIALKEFVSPRSDLALCRSLYRIFREEKPDIVHNMTVKPNVYGTMAARLAGVPRVVSLVCGAGYGFSNEKGWRRKAVQFVVRSLYRISGRLNTRMYFLNHDDLDLFVQTGIITPDRAVLVRGEGVNLQEFSGSRVDSDALQRLRGELGVAETTQVVLMVSARLIWSKGVREFVEASAMAEAWNLPVKFVLVGAIEPNNPDAVPEEYLRKAVSPGFLRLGPRDDIRELLALANVVVLPSYYREGVPRILIEALALEKPVVTTDNVGCREVVDDRQNGFLVPIRDSAALASTLRDLLDDRELQTKFGRHSYRKARDEFDETAIVQRILTDVYGLAI
jgi:glycosyltransferase involved in cell wall biosynthesis